MVPRKDCEVVAKDALGFTGCHPLLIEAVPFITEAGGGAWAEVWLLVISWKWKQQRVESRL